MSDPCPGGGTGRRGGLKPSYTNVCAGSNPVPGTNLAGTTCERAVVRLDVDVPGVDGESGRRRQRSRQGFRTKREAGLALADALHDASRSTSRSGTSLAEFLDGWLEGEAVLVRPSTLHSYRSAVTRITAGLGAIPVARLDACDVQRLETCLGDGGRRDGSPLAPRTVANVHAVLHKAMEIAVRDGLCAANPVAAVAPPRPAPRQVQVWTTAELRRFLAVADEHRLGAAFMLLATTGMRRSEVLGVRWRDVDFEQRCMSVVQTLSMVNGKPVVETPKAAASRRCVDLDTRTIQRLQRHREQADAAAVYVFESTNGGPLNPASFSTTFERLADAPTCPRSGYTTSATPTPPWRCATGCTQSSSAPASAMPPCRAPSTSTPTSSR